MGNWEVMAALQGRDDGGLGNSKASGPGEKWIHLRNIRINDTRW